MKIGSEHEVLLLAITDEDFALLDQVVEQAGVKFRHCASVAELCSGIRAGAALAMIADRDLPADAQILLLSELVEQPEWSDFPIVVLAMEGLAKPDGWKLVEESPAGRHLILAENPTPHRTLVGAIRTAYQFRLRQYQLRDRLNVTALPEVNASASEKQPEWSARKDQNSSSAVATGLHGEEQQRLASKIPSEILRPLFNARSQLNRFLTRGDLSAAEAAGKLIEDAIQSSLAVAHAVSPVHAEAPIPRPDIFGVSEPLENDQPSVQILVVDDHRMVREGLVTMLQDQRGFTIVGEASDGAEALEMASRLQPDVIIMDVNMPKMGGVESTRQIKQRFPDIQIIALSMFAEESGSRMMLEAGAAIFLPKGGPAGELFASIRGLHAGQACPGSAH